MAAWLSDWLDAGLPDCLAAWLLDCLAAWMLPLLLLLQLLLQEINIPLLFGVSRWSHFLCMHSIDMFCVFHVCIPYMTF